MGFWRVVRRGNDVDTGGLLAPEADASLLTGGVKCPWACPQTPLTRRIAAPRSLRNLQTLTIRNQSFADALASTSVAAEAFRQKYGLEPAGPEALRLGAEAVHGRLIKLHKEGGRFRLSVQRLFEKVCDRFDTRGIQVLTPVSASKEFLFGDLPAITVDRATGAAGRAAAVTIDQADEILMPLTPRLLIILGPPNGTRAIPDHEVDSHDALQARQARDYLITGPQPPSRRPPSQPGAPDQPPAPPEDQSLNKG